MKVPGVSKIPTLRIKKLKKLKTWHVVAAAVILVAAGGGVYRFYAEASNTPANGLSAEQQVVPVKYGDLVNQVAINGNLVFPQRQALTFGSAGTIVELKVEAGQRVSKGQALATLDVVTTASLAASAAQAKLDRQTAQEALDDARKGYTSLERAAAEEKVANARVQLQVAVETLEDAEKPYTQQELRTQEETVAAARVALQDATIALADFRRQNNLQWAEALQAKAGAEVALNTATGALTAYEKSRGRGLDQLRQDKAEAEAELVASQQELDRLVQAQQTLSGDLTSRIIQYQQFVEVHKERLQKAQAEVADLEQFEAAVELAQKQLDAAQAELGRLQNGAQPLATPAQVQGSTASSSLELALREAQVRLAQATLAQAQEDLAEMLKGADPQDVTWRERQVTLAEATLADAETLLAELLARPDPVEVAVREAELALAQARLDKSLQLAANAALKSPVDGIVSVLNVEAGDEVAANTVVAEIADTSVAELNGVVDEVDVLSLRTGVQARVTMDALPGRTLRGTLISVAPAATNQSGVVTYPIRVRLEIPQGVQAREGLSAAASIILREEKNVLVVPQQALRGNFEQPAVRVLIAPGVWEDRAVTLGDTDGFWVAIREGLKEGDQVVMEAARASTSQFNFRQLRGGGVPGGAGGFGGAGGGGGAGGTGGGTRGGGGGTGGR
ncbi:MAG TPA: efflux RND transporter periplasmic adaptor subunit [Dehalococcoidia bacterium]|nr:efflux RND transporter periplasmic adaptor subunit [Dehalococcoidia bacterium]